MGILLSNKKEQTMDISNNLNGCQGNQAKGKKPITKGYIVYDFIYITFFKLQK